MLETQQVERHLGIIKEIKQSYSLIDMHVHPFDVMINDCNYVKNLQHEGIYSANSNDYKFPAVGQLRISQIEDKGLPKINPDLRIKMALLSCRQLYTHSGSKVFSDHMKLSGIDKILLLPVMRAEESNDDQIKMLNCMFGADERFVLGYCVPNSIPENKIGKVVKNAVKNYRVKALKIHPNITGIDVTSNSGKQRIHHMLEASRETKLKVVIHGGRSTGLRNSDAGDYSILNNLQHIDWNITDQTVVIAHAGMCGYEYSQIKTEVLPMMNKLLSKYSNLFVDISGLNVDQIILILKNIDLQRVLFGSDALYNSQWSAVVKLLYALQQTGSKYAEHFVNIASKTPAEHFFAEEHSNDV